MHVFCFKIVRCDVNAIAGFWMQPDDWGIDPKDCMDQKLELVTTLPDVWLQGLE